MRYLCLIYDDESIWEKMPKPELDGMMGEYRAFTESIKQSGHHIGGDGLQPTRTATTVRVRKGKVSTTDGPFAETKDLIAGWMVIDVDSQERAIELAGELSAAPGAGGQPIHEWLEVRPFLTAHETCTG